MITLEVGKKYRTRDGKSVMKITKFNRETYYASPLHGSNLREALVLPYRKSGRYAPNFLCDEDLVEEVTD